MDKTLRRRLLRYGVDSVEVDDFIQETYLRVMTTIRQEVENVEAFVWTIARNLVIDRLRTKNRHAARLDAALQLDPPTDSVAAADEEAHASEVLRRVQLALHALPAPIREVVWMRKVDCLSQREIAAITGLSDTALDSSVALTFFDIHARK